MRKFHIRWRHYRGISQQDRELSGTTLAALQEFYTEREAQEKRFESLQNASEMHALKGSLTMDLFAEDWNASQFWVCEVRDIIIATGP